jgi:DNA-directed RNA polymerase subunit N (RpoN/RPB10)
MMNFFKKLFTPRPSNYGRFYYFSVKCKRCGEIIEGRVNLANDPSLEFDEKGKPYYICRKVLVGDQQCFQQIEVVFTFNELRGLLDQQITGGEFVEDSLPHKSK